MRIQAEAKGTWVVGVDIGGTKVAAGLVGSNGEIKTQIRTPMVANREAAWRKATGLARCISASDRKVEEGRAVRRIVRHIGRNPLSGVPQPGSRNVCRQIRERLQRGDGARHIVFAIGPTLLPFTAFQTAHAAGQREDAHAAQMELPADGAEPLCSFHG